MTPPDFSIELNRLMNPYWRKARIAARLLLKREAGKPWSARDRRLAAKLSDDRGVTNRLLDQAYALARGSWPNCQDEGFGSALVAENL